MRKMPKFIKLEKQIIELEKQRLAILIKFAKKGVTQNKNALQEVKIADEQFPKGDFKKKYSIEFASMLEQSEMCLEGLVYERKTLDLRIERLTNYIKERKIKPVKG